MAEEIDIEIFGQTFRIAAGGLSEDYVQRLVSYVDERMQSIAGTAASVSFNRMAVLTALNIADDLLKLQDRYAAISRTFSDKTEDLLALLERHVNDPAPAD